MRTGNIFNLRYINSFFLRNYYYCLFIIRIKSAKDIMKDQLLLKIIYLQILRLIKPFTTVS